MRDCARNEMAKGGKMEKKEYQTPEMQVKEIENEDILTKSTNAGEEKRWGLGLVPLK